MMLRWNGFVKAAMLLVMFLVSGLVLRGMWSMDHSTVLTCGNATDGSNRLVQTIDTKHGMVMEMFVFKNSQNESVGGVELELFAYWMDFYQTICGGACTGIALDVGAFVGAHTMLMSAAGFEVHSFEPHQQSAEILKCNAKLAHGPSIKILKQGVSSATGHECLLPSLGNHPENTMLMNKNMIGNDCPVESRVPVTTLDDYWENGLNKSSIHFVKLEAEGHEDHILRGAEKLLRVAPPPYVMLRYREQILSLKHYDLDDMLRIIYSAGYRLYDCDMKVELQKGETGRRLINSYKGSSKLTNWLLVHSSQMKGGMPSFECSASPAWR